MTDEARLDLHVHSRYSPDSRMTVEAIAMRVMEAGLRGFALTDHNTLQGLGKLAELQKKYPRYLFVPGVEISAHEGHLLAYGLSETPPRGRLVAETVDWVEAHGGVAVVAHPFRRNHGVGERVARETRIDALETRNGHNSEIANDRAELVAAQRHLGTTGGSDAHAPHEIGRAYTLVPEPHSTLDDLLEHLRRRATQAEGLSLTPWGQFRVGVRSAFLRVGRGFRPI